jgi:DNA mismatch endonuclease (patch repair protein)
MADVHTKEVRSYNMSKIRSKNTKPEIVVRKYLFANGFRYRLHSNYLPGTPDIVLPKYKTVIFVHGCFWHGHEGCKYFVLPKTRNDWWLLKIQTNIENNKQDINDLKQLGWRIIIIWECQLRKDKIKINLALLAKTILT